MAGRNSLPASAASVLADLLQVVEELQEHDPGEHRQAVEVAVQALVLAHDVAAGLDEAAEPLGRGTGGCSAFVVRAMVMLDLLTPHRGGLGARRRPRAAARRAAEDAGDLARRCRARRCGGTFSTSGTRSWSSAELGVLVEQAPRGSARASGPYWSKKSSLSRATRSARSLRVRSGALKARWQSRSNGSASGSPATSPSRRGRCRAPPARRGSLARCLRSAQSLAQLLRLTRYRACDLVAA